jgi:ABC-type multidrug transport system fused ATPase/permease subunit
MFSRMAARNAEMSDSWTKTFQGIGLAFTAMLTKMIEEMAVKAAIFGAFSLFSGGTITPGGGGLLKFLGFASGGLPPMGQPVSVGERRPETFVPRSAGHIQPTAGPGTVINITVSNPAEARSTARQLQREDRTRKKGLR